LPQYILVEGILPGQHQSSCLLEALLTCICDLFDKTIVCFIEWICLILIPTLKIKDSRNIQ
jgi:hypothetical protein